MLQDKYFIRFFYCLIISVRLIVLFFQCRIVPFLISALYTIHIIAQALDELLYHMELEPKEEKTSAEEIYQIRQEKALPLIGALFTWTRELEASIPPKSKLGEPSDMAIMSDI